MAIRLQLQRHGGDLTSAGRPAGGFLSRDDTRDRNVRPRRIVLRASRFVIPLFPCRARRSDVRPALFSPRLGGNERERREAGGGRGGVGDRQCTEAVLTRWPMRNTARDARRDT